MIVGRILVLTALLTAALAYMIWDRVSILSSDRVVTLKVVPVDPTDMFRGDYVILRYEISRLEPAQLAGDDTFVQDREVFVTLAQEAGIWKPVAVHRAHPATAAGQVVLRGTVDSISYTSGQNPPPPALSVSYGIESFFVPQGEGKAIEDERQKGDVSAEIAVASDGRAAIKKLLRQGSVIHVEGLF
jgi:uncharacterized membrane-anchored protein